MGHKGKFGHEFLEFEFRPDGQVRVILIDDLIKLICKHRAGVA